jgi:hypothetical protein
MNFAAKQAMAAAQWPQKAITLDEKNALRHTLQSVRGIRIFTLPVPHMCADLYW